MAISDQLFSGIVTFALANPASTQGQVLTAMEGMGVAPDDAVAFLTRFGEALVSFGYLDLATWTVFRSRVNALGEERARAGVAVIQQFMRSDPAVRLIDTRARRTDIAGSVGVLDASVAFADQQIATDGDPNRVTLFAIARDHLARQLDGQNQILEALDATIDQLESQLAASAVESVLGGGR